MYSLIFFVYSSSIGNLRIADEGLLRRERQLEQGADEDDRRRDLLLHEALTGICDSGILS